jgi:hypothetical protein
MAASREEIQAATEQAYALLKQEMSDEEIGMLALSLLARATGKQLVFVPAAEGPADSAAMYDPSEGGIES